jgi:hypothetical protein
MVMNCEQVWREVSDYLDEDAAPEVRAALEEHVRGCKRCAAVLDGTRNVVELFGDERMLEVPLGFSHRLQRRLQENLTPVSTRRGFLGWMAAAAAAVIAAGCFELGRSSTFKRPDLRSQMAQPAYRVPPDLAVVVGVAGKIFHVSTCTFIHDRSNLQTMTAREAERQGYAPCVRCMKQYLVSS